ncbi:MAG: Eco57I restriction-modification methylase domain-containing protein [Ignavibacteriales bacterium]|nr:Eco57I restriction-modification methylase domain-containing protein [Ignavibacteriales bacterium]
MNGSINFSRIEKYNFTIDENSSVDLEVSVDPEMLGRIFENLLAEIDPRNGESARKSTGSFYTPREIVDYMVSESLVRYLNNLTGIDATILCELLKLDSDVCLSDFEKERIIDAFDEIKILDPACGSGAFPLGIMQKMLIALQKIDTNAEKWKVRQISKIENVPFRNIERKIRDSSVDYSIKLGIIQNNLHGVDIQPIATEISKLRCFLSLIVDENIDDDKPNRGIEALPNLEFKFVATDSLMSLPEDNFGGLFDINNDLAKLQQIRNDYLQSYGQEKLDIKTKFKSLQKEIIKFQMTNRFEVHNSRLSLLSEWDPFGNESTDGFNPELMFGVKFFDIIIGNPPFGTPIKNVYRNAVVSRLGKVPDFEIYYYFIEIARLHLKITGILSYIIPNSFLFNVNARAYRAELLEAWSLFEILDCTRFPILNPLLSVIVLLTGTGVKLKQSGIIILRESQILLI